jgi:hypothetical protein
VRKRVTRGIVPSVTERATHLKLAVDVGSDPITGSVSVGSGDPSEFCGWIELVAAIEAARYDAGGAVELAAGALAAPEKRLG